MMVGCGGSSKPKAATVASIQAAGQRYVAAVDPANAALAAMLKRVLAYTSGPTTQIDAATTPTAATLKTAARQVNAIGAPGALGRDMRDVVAALNVVVGDLGTLHDAKGDAVETEIARFVADAGRESAADDLVRLAITELTTPTTQPPPTLEPATLPTTTTTVSTRRTTTTRPRTTTTKRATTTTIR